MEKIEQAKKDTDKESVSNEYKKCSCMSCEEIEGEYTGFTRIEAIQSSILAVVSVAITLLTISATTYVLLSIDNSVLRVIVLFGNMLIHLTFASFIIADIHMHKILKLKLYDKVEEYNKSEIKKTVTLYTLTAYILAVIAIFIASIFA